MCEYTNMQYANIQYANKQYANMQICEYDNMQYMNMQYVHSLYASSTATHLCLWWTARFISQGFQPVWTLPDTHPMSDQLLHKFDLLR